MSRVRIEIEVAAEYADESDLTGLTNEGYELLSRSIMAVADSVDAIERIEE